MVSRASIFGRRGRTETKDVQREVDNLRKDLRQVRSDMTDVMQTILQLGSERKEDLAKQLRDKRWGMQPMSDAYQSSRQQVTGWAFNAMQGIDKKTLGTVGTLLAVALGLVVTLLIKKLWWDRS